MENGPGGGVDFFAEGGGHIYCSENIPRDSNNMKELLRRCLSRYAC